MQPVALIKFNQISWTDSTRIEPNPGSVLSYSENGPIWINLEEFYNLSPTKEYDVFFSKSDEQLIIRGNTPIDIILGCLSSITSEEKNYTVRVDNNKDDGSIYEIDHDNRILTITHEYPVKQFIKKLKFWKSSYGDEYKISTTVKT